MQSLFTLATLTIIDKTTTTKSHLTFPTSNKNCSQFSKSVAIILHNRQRSWQRYTLGGLPRQCTRPLPPGTIFLFEWCNFFLASLLTRQPFLRIFLQPGAFFFFFLLTHVTLLRWYVPLFRPLVEVTKLLSSLGLPLSLSSGSSQGEKISTQLSLWGAKCSCFIWTGTNMSWFGFCMNFKTDPVFMSTTTVIKDGMDRVQNSCFLMLSPKT